MRKGWKAAAAGLALLLLGGCAAGQQGKPATASMEENQIVWAFTQANQHPERELIALIDGAKETLDIAIYSLTHPDIVQAIKKAHQRGVAVRIITDRSQLSGKTQGEAVKLLGSAGIPMKVNKHDGLMHLKMTIADKKKASTGSFNYSKAASTRNDEMLVVIDNPTIAGAFADEFERMWNDNDRFETLEARIAQPERKASSGAGRTAKETEAEEEAEESSSGPSSPAPCTNPQIKGNINAKGDKIYHVPGGPSYEQTKPEEMFCTEEDAVAAGYRPAK